MYCLDLIKFDVSNTSYYIEVENGAFCVTSRSCENDPWRLLKIFREKV